MSDGAPLDAGVYVDLEQLIALEQKGRKVSLLPRQPVHSLLSGQLHIAHARTRVEFRRDQGLSVGRRCPLHRLESDRTAAITACPCVQMKNATGKDCLSSTNACRCSSAPVVR